MATLPIEAAKPAVCSLSNHFPAPSLPPTCEEEWNRLASSSSDREVPDTVVYGLVWRERALVAVTLTGEVCIWDVPPLNHESEERDQVEMAKEFEKHCRPAVKVKVTEGILYSVDFIEASHERTLLIVSGDDGVLGFDWREWLDLLGKGEDERMLHVSSPPPTPLFHLRPHRSLATVEINHFAVSGNHLFGAAGDANGYKWDLATQSILATYPTTRRGYLHSIHCMPANNAVLMGGEDGVIGVWDGHHDKLIDNIDIQTAIKKESSLLETDTSIHGTAAALPSNMWISHIHSPSDSWWTVCGGIGQPAGTTSSDLVRASTASSVAGGYVTSWHAPTRSLVAGRLTRETPQYQCSTVGTLVTVANEGVVSHWTPSRLQRTGRVWCSSPSCFAAAIRTNGDGHAPDEVLAVGGVGTLIDIYDNVVENKSCSLSV